MIRPSDLYVLAEGLGGIPLLGCFPGSPSHEAGLRYGDVILKVNGQRVHDIQEYFDAKKLDSVGMTVVVHRAGAEVTATLTYSSREPAPESAPN